MVVTLYPYAFQKTTGINSYRFSKTESKYAFFYVTTQQKFTVSLKINEKNTQNAKERKKTALRENLY
jgi:hypothetical protein